jgi:hypothetical protein
MSSRRATRLGHRRPVPQASVAVAGDLAGQPADPEPASHLSVAMSSRWPTWTASRCSRVRAPRPRHWAWPLGDIAPFLRTSRRRRVRAAALRGRLEDDRLRGGQGQVVYVKGLDRRAAGPALRGRAPVGAFTAWTARPAATSTSRTTSTPRRHVRHSRTSGPARSLPDNGSELLGLRARAVTTGTVTRARSRGIEATTLHGRRRRPRSARRAIA